MHRCAVLTLAAVLTLSGVARAADPIMPLSEVRAGMSCTALSVIHGTTISSFNADVLDVIADDVQVGGARLLVRVSGPAVDATGVGPGFSGSPIICNGRYAGAISEGIGDYGNKVVLATPIEAILGARPNAPASAGTAPALLRSARPLTAPLTVSGLSTRTRRLLSRAAARSDRTVLAAPPGPVGGYPVQTLVPGAAVAATIATGDISVGAVGTVAYRDGDQIFAFGHALDGLGRRTLFMQDAYVFGVIGNPVGIPDLGAMTYKLASSGGHPVGTITNDTFSAIAGTLGGGPDSVPLRVSARLRGSSERVTLDSRLADERPLQLGVGLGVVAPLAASTAIDRVLGSFEPAELTVCVRFRVRELRRPLGFCNPYFDSFTPLGDVATAATLVDSFDLPPLHIRGAAVSMEIGRGFASDVVADAEPPDRVRAGSTARVRLSLRRRGGGRRTLTVGVPVPSGIRPGRRTLVLEGNGVANPDEVGLDLFESLLFGGDSPSGGQEPRTPAQLARAISALRRPLGIEAHFRHRDPRVVLRSNDVRFEGRVRVSVRVVRARR